MTKTITVFCDKCNKEIRSETIIPSFRMEGGNVRKVYTVVDLCPDCIILFKAWMIWGAGNMPQPETVGGEV